MWGLDLQISAVTVFLTIAAVGFLFAVVSLLFGEVFEHADFAHDFDHDGGPSLLSPRVISVFMTAFGGFGAIATFLGFGVFTSSFFGFIGGVVLASIVYAFARFLYSQQASSTINIAELVGRTAHVTVGIPTNGYGQVRCLVGESVVEKIARSRNGGEIPNNAVVRIEEVVGESVIVSPATSPQAASNAP